MLVKGWIKPSVSPYSSPVLFVLIKTGKLRMYIDVHALNINMQLNAFNFTHIVV